MKSPLATWMCLVVTAALSGCASVGDVDLLESQLRTQEDTIANLQRQLSVSTEELRVAQAESASLRQELTERGRTASILPEQSNVLYRVDGIELNRFFTGGTDKDGQPGDDALTVLLTPRDKDGDLIKVPGEIHVDVFDMTQAPDQQKIGTWDFTAEQSREHWYSGFVGSGFRLELPWQSLPSSTGLTVHAELSTTDGREFHTTRQIKITPPQSTQTAATTEQKPRVPFEEPPRLIPPPAELDNPFEDVEAETPAPVLTPSGHTDEEPRRTETSDRWTPNTRPTLR